jgi:outer membrane protein, multidrug efflux system
MKASVPIALGLAMLTGCVAVGPDYERAELTTPANWSEPLPGVTDAAHANLGEWWREFGDATLNELVERTLQHNHDLREAQSRIREARAIAGVARGGLAPEVDAEATGQRLRRSENDLTPLVGNNPENIYQAGFDASWEIDLFGGLRRGVEAARADLAASVENRRAIEVALVAEVARQYVELRSLQGRLENARKNIQAMSESAELAQARYDAGMTSELDAIRAQELLELTRAQIPQFEAGIVATRLRLGVLLGEPSAALPLGLGEIAELPRLQPRLPAILPSELLLRRPDLRRAERELAAANARLGIATADLYPRFSLTGVFGSQATRGDKLNDPGSRIWSFGPTLHLPLFHGGRIRANIRAQDARLEQALIRYERSLLIAIEEVERSTSDYLRQSMRTNYLRNAEKADADAVGLATERYTGGFSDYSVILDTQRQLYATSEQRLQSERDSLANLIALYKAVGGGWTMADESEEGG